MAPIATASLPVQKEILAAIQRLSDRMDAQDIAATTAMELRFVNQDELTSLRANKRIDPLASRLDSIDDGLHSVAEQLKALNGTVRAHDKEISQLKVFCDEQVKPALVRVQDMRVELAKMAAAGGGFGIMVTALIAAGKAMGWW
jgi:predicted  nucleic acid-binding Zn-ribbon protein